jgi:hypothetical protein
MLISVLLIVVGMAATVRGCAMLSPAAGWIAFGLSALVLSMWPAARDRFWR